MNQENFRLPEFSMRGRDLLEQSKLAHLPFCFIGLRLVCDECAAPLHLYGENFIETYTEGRVNILRCLCDLHADELEVKK